MSRQQNSYNGDAPVNQPQSVRNSRANSRQKTPQDNLESVRNSRANSRQKTPQDNRDTPYSDVRSLRTPSEDRQLLRALTVSPETGTIVDDDDDDDLSLEQSPTPTPYKPSPVARHHQSQASAVRDRRETPKSESDYGDASVTSRDNRDRRRKDRTSTDSAIPILPLTDREKKNDWQEGKTLSEANNYMLRYEVAADVTFVVGERKEEMRAHKYIMLSRSSVFFKSMMKHLGNVDLKINVPDVKPAIFKDFLTYLYTDEFDMHMDNVLNVLFVGKKYAVKGLTGLCFRFLESEMSFENVGKIMEQAHVYDEQVLYQKCLKYMRMNGEETLKAGLDQLCADCVRDVIKSDDLRAKEETVWEATIAWAKQECSRKRLNPRDGKMREVLGKLVYLIRFTIMDPTYFTQRVSMGDILSKEETVSIFQYIHGETDKLPSKFNKNPRSPNPTSLAENSEPVRLTSGKNSKVSRVSRYTIINGQWRQRGPPDAISFTCSSPIVLYGVEVYGSALGSHTYDVQLSVFDDMKEEVRRNEVGVFTDSTRNMYDVYLAKPIRIPPQRTFTVMVQMKGEGSKKGMEGKATHEVDGVTFNFINSNRSSNGTDVNTGQLPGLIFNKTH